MANFWERNLNKEAYFETVVSWISVGVIGISARAECYATTALPETVQSLKGTECSLRFR